MTDSRPDWDGKEWQKYSNELIATHHSLRGECYQRIPDETDGDHGLEGITDSGDAYQSYSDQGSMNNAEKTRKQKKKIYDDLKKLEKFEMWWETFLGDGQIHRWTLMVPDVRDKEVVKYAKKRARELRKESLKFIADDFDAFVKTQDDFPAAKSLMRNPRLPSHNPSPVTAKDIETFKSIKPQFVQNIDRKLTKAMSSYSEVKRQIHRDLLLTWHLQSSNYIDDLDRKYPSLWEELAHLIERTGESIETEEPFDVGPAHQRLTKTRERLDNDLKESMPFIPPNDRLTISWGTISLWLGECPLDFMGGNDG